MRSRRIAAVGCAVAAATGLLALAGCGARSASAQRSDLARQLRENIERSAPGGVYHSPLFSFRITSALVDCVVARAQALPLAQLRQLARHNPPDSLSGRVIGQCVQAGEDVSAIRAAIGQVVANVLPRSFPVGYRRCVLAHVSALGARPLGQLLIAGASDPQAAVRFGRGVGFACVREHPKLLRHFILAGMASALACAHVPSVFMQCMVRKLEAVPARRLLGLLSFQTLTGRPGAAAALGRALAASCLAAERHSRPT
ncbi:MAG TPA: hypothetical protein VE992_05410 [Solirubrobacteraceae bacterium]|nr:hypothetical protein [Solirubrobacteraceae bacterium]